MDQQRIGASPRLWPGVTSRRHLLRGLVGATLGWGVGRLPADAEAKEKRRKKRRRTNDDTGPRCTKRGEACSRAGSDCQERFCLRAPFTISAVWDSENNHDTWLFVPPQDETTGPRPQIDYDCTAATTACESQYPYACVSGDDLGPGDEITTIFELLPGTYEYWIASDGAPAGDLTVTLTDHGGRVVRTWRNPAIDAAPAWHVFDFDGETGRIRSIDAAPAPFPLPVTNVCPE